MEKYKLIKKLCNRNNRKVFEYEETKKNGKHVAIKILCPKNDEKELKGVKNEIETMKLLNGNENIVKLLDWFEECNSEFDSEHESFFLVMELASCNLVSLRQGDLEERFNADCVLFILRSMLKGLKYMHDKKVIHRDMKPDNVLISKQGVVKLADFGLAERRGVKGAYISPYVCSTYIAPEIAGWGHEEKLQYDYKVDMWGVGCIVYELIVGQMLYKEIFPQFPFKLTRENFDLIKRTTDFGKTLDNSDSCNIKNMPQYASDGVKNCLSSNPELRPTAKEFLKWIDQRGDKTQVEKGRKVIKEILEDDDLSPDHTQCSLLSSCFRSEGFSEIRQENVEFGKMKSEIRSLRKKVERITDQLHATRKQVEMNSEKVSQTKEFFESETMRRLKEAQKNWSSRSKRSTSRERLHTDKRPSRR